MKLERVQPGQFRVWSETTEDRVYSVMIDMVDYAGGVCNCQGYEGARRAGHACKHLKAAIEAEKEHQDAWGS